MEGAGPVIVGAVAEQLVRLAPCPVLAVAADWNAGEFRPAPGGPVLLAMERNEATAAAVSTACSLAEKFHRTLLVVHARTGAEASADPCAATAEEFGIKSTELPCGALLGQGWQSGGGGCRSRCRSPSQPAGSRSEAHQRDARTNTALLLPCWPARAYRCCAFHRKRRARSRRLTCQWAPVSAVSRAKKSRFSLALKEEVGEAQGVIRISLSEFCFSWSFF